MFLFAIKFDKNKMDKDNLIDSKKAYEYIEKEFQIRDINLYKIDDGIHYYGRNSRNTDKKDFENLFMANLPFKNSTWFCYYVEIWDFLDLDDDSLEVKSCENMIEKWVQRPLMP